MARVQYFDADLLFKNGIRTKILRPNTVLLYNQDNSREIVFWNTTICRFNSDNTISLFNGGHTSFTTKVRLNFVLNSFGYGVYQDNFSWHIAKLGEHNKDCHIEFEDGITLNINWQAI